MKTVILIFFTFISTSFAQEITENPLRMVGTNIFDFTPLIYLFQHGEITSSEFLVSGQILQKNGNEVKIVHKELRNQLTDEFKKQMLFADPQVQLKMTYAAQVVDRWRNGQLSTGEFMSLDSSLREIIYDEIQREKNDFIEVGSFVKNLPSNYLHLGKSVKFFALPIGASQYDYGTVVVGDANAFTNRFLVTIRGYIKPQTSKNIGIKANVPVASKN
jgi:hypothetical protein